MKTLPLILSLVSIALPSFGQAYVNFGNAGNRISTNGVQQTVAPIGTWYYALFAASSTQNTFDGIHLSGWSFVGYGTNNTLAGRVNGNTTTDGSGVLVPGFSAGQSVDLAVVGWSGYLGHDVFQVLAGFHGFNQEPDWFSAQPPDYGLIGMGAAQEIILAPLGGPYNSPFGSSPGLIPGLNLIHPSPEPSVFALAAVGAMILIVLRQRKNRDRTGILVTLGLVTKP